MLTLIVRICMLSYQSLVSLEPTIYNTHANTVSSIGQKEAEISLLTPALSMKCRKVMKGHRGRVLHFAWSPDKRHVVTAGQVSS